MNFEEMAHEIKKCKKIRIISHYDTDGISAAAVLVKTLDQLNIEYILSFVPLLEKTTIEKIAKEPFENILFLDLGSGSLDELEESFAHKNCMIIDHHKPIKDSTTIKICNAHLLGIDGNNKVSGSTMAYYVCKELKAKNIAALSSLGIVGDMQMKNLSEENKAVLDQGITEGLLTKQQDQYSIYGYTLEEFSKLLNASGRLGKASIGLGACLGNKEMITQIRNYGTEYKQQLEKAMDWIKSNRTTSSIIETNAFMIINAKDKISFTSIGTICAFAKDTYQKLIVLGMARSDHYTKISIRSNERDVHQIMKESIGKLKQGEFGGHVHAAGAIIPTEKEKEFIEIVHRLIDKRSLEEAFV